MGPIDSVAINLEPAASAAGTGAGLQVSGASPAAFDVAQFNAAYAAAAQPVQQANATEQTTPVAASDAAGFRSVLASLEGLNENAASIGADAGQLGAGELRPSEMLMLTMKAEEFMFHCELTANVANRTSDGVQQLFQQQS